MAGAHRGRPSKARTTATGPMSVEALQGLVDEPDGEDEGGMQDEEAASIVQEALQEPPMGWEQREQ